MGRIHREGYRAGLPGPKKRRKERLWLWLIPTVPLVMLLSLFVYLSMRPRMQLTADPPAEFLVARPEWDAQQRETEQRLARAYWDCTVKVIRWRYFYGSSLPPTPPAEFRIDLRALPNAAAATPESRDYYWQRLRVVWPEAWREVQGWDTDWLDRLFKSLRSSFPSVPEF